MVRETVVQVGRLDILFGNAGVYLSEAATVVETQRFWLFRIFCDERLFVTRYRPLPVLTNNVQGVE